MEEQNLLDNFFWPDLADMNTSVLKRKPRHLHRDLNRLQRLQEAAANEASVDAGPNINVGGRNMDQQFDAVNAGMENCPSALSLESMRVAEESATKLNAIASASESSNKQSAPQLAPCALSLDTTSGVAEELNAELNAVNVEMEAHPPGLSLQSMSVAEKLAAEYIALSAMASASQSLEDPQLEPCALSFESTSVVEKLAAEPNSAHPLALSLQSTSVAEELAADLNAVSELASDSKSVEQQSHPQLVPCSLSLESMLMVEKAELDYLMAMASASIYFEQESAPKAPYRDKEKLAAIGAKMKGSSLRLPTLKMTGMTEKAELNFQSPLPMESVSLFLQQESAPEAPYSYVMTPQKQVQIIDAVDHEQPEYSNKRSLTSWQKEAMRFVRNLAQRSKQHQLAVSDVGKKKMQSVSLNEGLEMQTPVTFHDSAAKARHEGLIALQSNKLATARNNEDNVERLSKLSISQSSSPHRYDRHPCIPAQRQLKFSPNPSAMPSVTDFQSMGDMQVPDEKPYGNPFGNYNFGGDLFKNNSPRPRYNDTTTELNSPCYARPSAEQPAPSDHARMDWSTKVTSHQSPNSHLARTSSDPSRCAHFFPHAGSDSTPPAHSERTGASTLGYHDPFLPQEHSESRNSSDAITSRQPYSADERNDDNSLFSVDFMQSSFANTSKTRQEAFHSTRMEASRLKAAWASEAESTAVEVHITECGNTKEFGQHKSAPSGSPIIDAVELASMVPVSLSFSDATFSKTTFSGAKQHEPQSLPLNSGPLLGLSEIDAPCVSSKSMRSPCKETEPLAQTSSRPTKISPTRSSACSHKVCAIEASPSSIPAKGTYVSATKLKTSQSSAKASAYVPKTVTQAASHTPNRGMSTPYTPARHSSHTNVARGGPNTPATRTPLPSTQVDQSPVQRSPQTRTQPAKASPDTPVTGTSRRSRFQPSSTSHVTASPATYPPPVYRKDGTTPRSAPAKYQPPSRS